MIWKWAQETSFSEEKRPGCFIETAEKKIGKNYLCENGVSIYRHFHYNGSGPTAFGGAKSWPVVELNVAFEEGQIKERDEFAQALRMWVDGYFRKANP